MVPKYQLIVLGFFGSFILTGIPYWQLAYNQIALPNSLFGFPLFAVVILGTGLRLFSSLDFRNVLLAVGGGIPTAVLCRIVFETISDPTTHNLWPFEVVIASIVGLTVGAIAGWLGGIAQKFFKNSHE